MSESDTLRERLRDARNRMIKVQHEIRDLKRQLYQEQHKKYVERLERFNREYPGPQDLELWWSLVRPLCQDCQREIVRPDDHSLVTEHGGPPILCCGRHDPW